MQRALPAVLGFLAAALVVIAALLPEYEVGGVGIAQVDPGRLGWVPTLVGILVEVGLILSAALMLALGESRQIAGGIFLGAGILGLTLRVVRLFQIGDVPEFQGGTGSYVDALAAVLVIVAGVMALAGSRDEPSELDDLYEDEGEEQAPPLPPETP